MLSAILRLELLVLAIAFLVVVGVTVNKGKLQLRYALIWIFAATMTLLGAIFPGLVAWGANLFGFETSSNFVFFCVIAFLVVLTFGLTAISSQQSARIRTLTQELAIREYEGKDQD